MHFPLVYFFNMKIQYIHKMIMLKINLDHQPKKKINLPSDVKFLLYTRPTGTRSLNSYTLLANDVKNLQASRYNTSHPTKILIHGFSGSANSIIIASGKDVEHYPNDTIPRRWIGRGGEDRVHRVWSPRSPDLTPVVFICGVHERQGVCTTTPCYSSRSTILNC
ncbi:hypothetical protein ANN_26203 [Periplaneta americana]|uniref:Uncharacterized protein n=1 Tax=Periplaneta americana TaxID=6978 RepID=A0ABQ8S5T0_PERAM|nr:hypothetical protein ANN_26203 [Periplaneta americana]